jgi:hypothetical protein
VARKRHGERFMSTNNGNLYEDEAHEAYEVGYYEGRLKGQCEEELRVLEFIKAVAEDSDDIEASALYCLCANIVLGKHHANTTGELEE